MRHIVLSAVFFLSCGAAMASSIEQIPAGPKGGEGSILDKTCVGCPAPKIEVFAHQYAVPELKTGTQTMEIRDIGGEKKVVRTEAWMGGSPVVFISKATPEAIAAADKPTDGIDLTATTAAVAPAASSPAPATIDLSGFKLRLQ